jgi:hypothetical protein
MPARKPARKPPRKRVGLDPSADIDSPINAAKIDAALEGVRLPVESRGGNRKARKGKRPELRYLAEPTLAAYWTFILTGSTDDLIRPLPGMFPPAVPMSAFMRDLESLVSRLAEQRQEAIDALLFRRVNREYETARTDREGSFSERDLAKSLRISKDRVHRTVTKARLLAAMREHLAKTLPQRIRDHQRTRSNRKSRRAQ